MQDLQGIPNPFADSRMQNPWDFDSSRTPDIESIHELATQRCLQLLDQEVRTRRQASLLIHGASGCGKTHLTARLLLRLADPQRRALACYFNLQSWASEALWHQTRKTLFKDLLRQARSGLTGLERLLENRLPGQVAGLSAGGTPQAEQPQGLLGQVVGQVTAVFRGRQQNTRARLRERLEKELFTQVDLPKPLRIALVKLFSDSEPEVKAARDWLCGEDLDLADADRLGLRSFVDFDDSRREEHSQELVTGILRLSNEKLPLVLIFDQVEGLQKLPTDADSYYRFGTFFTRLRMEERVTLFLLSFIRSDRRELFLDALGAAYKARIAERELALQPLTWQQSYELVSKRMKAVPELNRLREAHASQGGDACWPFTRSQLEGIHRSMQYGCTPQGLLGACQKEFDRLTGGGIDVTVADFLATQWEGRRKRRLAANVEDRLTAALNSLPWLSQLLGAGYTKLDAEPLKAELPDICLLLQSPQGERIAFAVCAKTASVWSRFNRISKQWSAHIRSKDRCQELIVVSDSPQDGFTPKTRDHLDNLCGLNGVSFVHPADDKLQALAALQSLLGDAQTGQLALAGQPIDETAVHDWAAASIREPLHRLGELKSVFSDFTLDLPAGSTSPGTPGAVQQPRRSAAKQP